MPAETQLREIFDALGDGVFIANSEGRYIDVNPAACAMMGHTREEILARTFTDLLDPSDWERLPGKIRLLSEGGVHRSEWLFRRADGSKFTGELVGGQLPNGSYQSIVRDITERVAMAEHEQMLRGEALHRTKNILAVVQAVARQTAAASPADFVALLDQRIAALAASHDLFAQNAWNPVSLKDLVQTQLAPFIAEGSDRLTISGPDIEVGTSSAQSIGMALHELATNAVKYGAFANADGKVSIGWEVDNAADPPTFSLSWSEMGGPPVTPPTRKGFGSRMIARLIEGTLSARTVITFDPAGILWKLECTLASLTGK